MNRNDVCSRALKIAGLLVTGAALLSAQYGRPAPDPAVDLQLIRDRNQGQADPLIQLLSRRLYNTLFLKYAPSRQIPRQSDFSFGTASISGKDALRMDFAGYNSAYLVAPRIRSNAFSPMTVTNDSWVGGNGDWSVASNWSTGVPAANNSVLITVPANVTLDVNGVANSLDVSSGNIFVISDNTSLTVTGSSITNAGKIDLNSTANTTQLVIGGSNVTLSGGGVISMSNYPNNVIAAPKSGAGNKFTNQETIQGSGDIGNTYTALVNSGTINANQSTQLIIDTGVYGTTNSGTLEATNAGTLGFNGTTVTNTSGTINTSAGSIDAVNTTINGGTVTLAGGSLSGTTINGAKVTVAGSSDLTLTNASLTNGTLNNSAQLETLFNSANTVGGTVTNAATGLIQIDYGSSLTLQSGTYSNAGTISLNASNYNSSLIIGASNVTLGGGGSISMDNSPNNLIYGLSKADTLTNQETIQGAGNIGDGQMTLVNSGTINANQPNQLIIAANGGTTNSSLLEATNAGTLGFNGTTVTNTSGTINTSAGSIDAVNTTINGGTVTLAGGSLSGTTINGAKVTVAGSSDLTLTNASLTNGTLNNSAQLETLFNSANTVGGTVTNAATGLIQIDYGSSLTLQSGTYSNAGTISLNASNYNSSLIIGASNVTLGGGGSISMDNSPNNLIYGLSKADTLTNQETIQGAGNIGDGQMTLVNSGTINANQPNALTIDANGGFTNTGTLSVASGSTLQITTDTPFQNFSGSTHTLTGGTYNVAGTLQFGASGTTLVTNAASITLNGTTAAIQDTAGNNMLKPFADNSSGASFALAGGAIFATAGNFTNNGSLTVGSGSKFYVNGGITNLSGTTLTGGTYNLGGTLQFGVSGTSLVTNASSIALYGTSSQIIDTAGNNILKNFADNASTGVFTLEGLRNFTTAGNFTNSGILNINSGSKFAVNGNLSNFASGTLTGGTYLNAGTLQFNGANIITNAANLTMTGTASKITDQTGTANALANFATNAAAGTFTLSGNQSLAVAGNFSNAGTLTVASGSTFGLNNSGAYTQSAGSTIVDGTLKSSVTTAALNLNAGSVFGTGTLGFSVVNAGTLTPGNSSASTSLLDVSGTYKQNSGGILNISIAGTTAGTKYDQLKVTGAATVGGTLNLSLLNGYVPTVGTVFDILSGSSVSGSFATVNGAINSSEHFTVTCTAGNCDATVVSGAAKAGLTPALALASPLSSHLVSGPSTGNTGGYSTSMANVPAASHGPLFPASPLAMMPSKLARIASSPFNAGNGRGYKGVEFGVDVLSLVKTSPRKILKAFTGSEYVPPVGYLSSMAY